MIEDIIENPRGELRWFLWAFLSLGALTFLMWLVVVAIVALTGGQIIQIGQDTGPILIPSMADMGGSPNVVVGAMVENAALAASTQLVNQFWAIFALIGVITLRNFLSAFRLRHPRRWASLALVLLFYFGSYSTFIADYNVLFAIAITGAVWAQLPPIPKSGQRMAGWAKGLTIGLLAALATQVARTTDVVPIVILLIALVLAFGWSITALVRRRPFEAAVTAICASLPSLAAIAYDAATGPLTGIYPLLIVTWSGLFIIALVALGLDTFVPDFAERPEPIEEEPQEPEDGAADADAAFERDEFGEPRVFGRHLPFATRQDPEHREPDSTPETDRADEPAAPGADDRRS